MRVAASQKPFLDALSELRVGKIPPVLFPAADTDIAYQPFPPEIKAIQIFTRRSCAAAFNTAALLRIDHPFRSFRPVVRTLRRPPSKSGKKREPVCFEVTINPLCKISEARLTALLNQEFRRMQDQEVSIRVSRKKGSGSLKRKVVSLSSSSAATEADRKKLIRITNGALQSLKAKHIVGDVIARHHHVATESPSGYDKHTHAEILRTCTLKLGCQVMLTRNLNPNHVNGAIGTVVSFTSFDPTRLPQMSRYQRNLQRAFASVFLTDGIQFPLVRFENGLSEDVLIPFIGVGLDDNCHVGFHVPLVPAYAFTVHKIQGVTIRHPVQFNCGKMFPCNHIVYTAASRVQKVDHFRIVGCNPSRDIRVNEKALHFTQCLHRLAA